MIYSRVLIIVLVATKKGNHLSLVHSGVYKNFIIVCVFTYQMMNKYVCSMHVKNFLSILLLFLVNYLFKEHYVSV